MRTSNPMMKEKVFTQAIAGTETMTLQGAVNKTVALLALVVIGASYSWNLYYNQGPEAVQPWMIGGLIGGFVFAMITIFKAAGRRKRHRYTQSSRVLPLAVFPHFLKHVSRGLSYRLSA